MKNLKYILAAAVVILGIGFSAYASDDGISDNSTGALNINTATVQELSMLPFIDRETAQNIVDLRASHGPFTSIDELKKVKGINLTVLNGVSSHVKVDGESDFNPYGAVH